MSMTFHAVPDAARELERSMLAFDAASHEALVADRREAAAQTLRQALDGAAADEDRALVRDVLGALDAAGLGGVYRVAGTRGGAAWMWMAGDKKRPGAAALRDEAVATLRGAGLRAEMVGCWDFEVRRT
jgi:hypothetical protein